MRHVALVAIIAGLLVSLVNGQAMNDDDDRYRWKEADWAENKQAKRHCQSCNPDECPSPVDCVAGIVKDPCQCCDVCGKAEFELCDHPQVVSDRLYGRCGENLECRVRHDLDMAQGLEAICYCRDDETVCGTDDVTYDSQCQLNAAASLKQLPIGIARNGPCNSAPVILSPPENVKNATGTSVAILCEAKGYPIPTVEWTWMRVDGQMVYLPSDDLHISVNMRGGPEKWQVTGWLQIIDLQKQHEGDYTCIAQNEHGVDRATARVNVVDRGEDDEYGRDL